MAPLTIWFVLSDLILAATFWFIAQRKSTWCEIFASIAVILLLGSMLLPIFVVNKSIVARRQWNREHPHHHSPEVR